MMRAYFRAASLESSSLFAPVHTIFPDEKIKAVVRGSRIRIITAAKRFGLYSAFRACSAIFFRSSLQLRLTVETIFCSCGNMDESIGVIAIMGLASNAGVCTFAISGAETDGGGNAVAGVIGIK